MSLAKNTGRAWFSLCFSLLIFPLWATAANNISITPYLDYNYSSNIFWDSSAVSDAIFSPGLGLNFATRQFNFFLNADSKIYRSNNYLNQSAISGGFNFFKLLSKRSSFFLSPDFSLTQFKGEMSYLNTIIPSLAVGLKHVFSTQVYGRIGFNLRHSNYLEEDSYDRLRTAVFGEISAFFRTQTTLRLTLGLNYLFFPHIVTEIASATSALTLNEAATAMGRRRHAPDPSLPQPGAQVPAISTTTDLTFPQPYIVFRAAQGLGYKTGLIAEIQYRKNRNLVQNFDLLAIDEWALQQMDEDFFWQGTRLSISIKTEAILKLEIAIDFSYYLKQYDGLDALDKDGDPILPQAFRADRLSQVTMKIAKSLGNFGFYLTGSYRKNISNDLYFRYDFYSLSAGLDYGF
ncbi:MAG: hypothetical protein WCL37_04610 [Chrysiogenales bacterium]